ncbi:MAG: hypothetical protein MK105_18850 [Crocinitomicaceae bacterium]|nr:hypothetical protein [Crocinitomicaceae bacterium]
MDKKEILKKMKALTSKTVDQGATEAEAIAAAYLLKNLQDKYQVTLTELDVTEAEYVEKVFKCGQTDYTKSPLHPVNHCWYGIQTFCHVKTVFTGNRISLFGEPHNVENALYMYSLIRNAMDIEFNRYMLTSEYEYERAFVSPNSIRATFLNSMAERIANRLDKMASDSKRDALRNTPKASDGTSLVVVADRELQKQHKVKWPKLVSFRSSMTINSGTAKDAGRSAGDRTSLNKGVGSGSNGSTLTLGRG